MKYRSKPVVIEAVQFLADGPNTVVPPGVTLWSDTNGPTPRDMSWGYVVTIHGQRAHVQHGDYIIPEPDGEHYYPCKPDIFEAKYEPVEELNEFNEPGFDAEGPTDEELKERGIISEEDGA